MPHGLVAQGGGVVADISGIISYSVKDCVNACSVFNTAANVGGRDLKCQAVVFNSFMANSTKLKPTRGNCWLKNGTVADGVQMTDHPGAVVGKLLS